MELKKIAEFLNGDLLVEFTEAFELAREEFEKVEKKGELSQPMTNLKLYDIAYEFDLNNMFDFFCEMEYEHFQDFLNENRLDTIHIGRTSSFYIIPERLNNTFDDLDYFYTYDIPYSLEYEAAIDFVSDLFDKLNNDDIEIVIEDLQEELLAELDTLEFFINFTLGEIEDDIKSVNEGYEYIDNFKDNQVEIYEEFLQFQDEN